MALGSVGVVALYVTLARDWADDSGPLVPGAVKLTLIAVLAQAAHFGEELSTRFPEELPAMFGFAPMPVGLFVTFNVAWLLIWTLCARRLGMRSRVALFPLWFLGIASAVNGVAHPLLAASAGGYFPGLVTAPLVGVVGVVLLRRLVLITQSASEAPTSS